MTQEEVDQLWINLSRTYGSALSIRTKAGWIEVRDIADKIIASCAKKMAPRITGVYAFDEYSARWTCISLKTTAAGHIQDAAVK